MKIKSNPKMKLQIPDMNCDGGYNDNLEKYEMLNHLNKFCFTAIIGLPGSGKTSTLVSFLTGKKDSCVFRKKFNHILLVMPAHSRESLKVNIFKKHHAEKMFDELNYKTITTIHDKLVASSEEKETTLLILDDVGASLKLADIQRTFKTIIYNRRHLKVKIVILLQSYVSLVRECRKLLNNILIFKPSLTEWETLFHELFETIDFDYAKKLLKWAYTEPHSYLFLNVPSQKLYLNFDEIILPDEDKDETTKNTLKHK